MFIIYLEIKLSARYISTILVDVNSITIVKNIVKMGQMLSREDDDEHQYDDEQQEPKRVDEEDVKEKPKRRQRNPGAQRSRKPRAAAQGRTRRNRANHITFDIRDH